MVLMKITKTSQAYSNLLPEYSPILWNIESFIFPELYLMFVCVIAWAEFAFQNFIWLYF